MRKADLKGVRVFGMIAEIKAVLEKHKDYIPVVSMAELLAVLDDVEEYCEWSPVGVYGWLFLSPHEVKDGRYKEDIQDRPYCPVCGRKIKVKE